MKKNVICITVLNRFCYCFNNVDRNNAFYTIYSYIDGVGIIKKQKQIISKNPRIVNTSWLGRLPRRTDRPTVRWTPRSNRRRRRRRWRFYVTFLSSIISHRTGAKGYARLKSSLLPIVQRTGLAANPLAGTEVCVRANTRTLWQGIRTGRALRTNY